METQVEVGTVQIDVDWLERWNTGLDPTLSAKVAGLWNHLLQGSLRIIDQHSDEAHHYLELVPARGTPLVPRDLKLWLPTLLGNLQKVVAVDEKRAVSTVASAATRCLGSIGLHCTARETPLLLVMMAHIGESSGADTADACHAAGFARSIVVKARRPDSLLPPTLSPSEVDVIRLRIDGLSHARIASIRSRSARTVANQLASVYMKLGVSSRVELLARLARAACQPDRWSPLSPQSTVAA
jgi:DNA-binding CsgD family transcriptional regulator